MTGQNLVWVAEITAGRGVLERNEKLVDQAFRRIADELRVSAGEGIQSDFSFHQHGPCLYNHGYGAGFIVDCSRIATIVQGTSIAFARGKIELLAHLILDGTQWMSRGQATDFGAEGREITRKDQTARHLVAASNYMLQLPTGRELEFRDLLARAAGQPTAPPLVGNRCFWRSDFMTHQRPGYYASARMYSAPVANTDGPANGEGLLSHHVADGCFVLMQNGSEYHDLFGVWDWQKIPGTTAQQRGRLSGSPRRMGTTHFVGGVSDGQYGMAADDFACSGLVARKNWIFFDQEIVCLGAGITSSSDNPVVTTINQCRLRGDVDVSIDGHIQIMPLGECQLENVEFVWHDHVAYGLLEPAAVSIRNGRQTGNWYTANRSYPDKAESQNIFTLWIDHGSHPQRASYAYVVFPSIAINKVPHRLVDSPVHILSNTPELQAVKHDDLKFVSAAFYEPGALHIDSNRVIRVNQPCLLLTRFTDDHTTWSVSDPQQETERLHIELLDASDPSRNQTLEVALPQGLYAGQSVTLQQTRR